MRACFQQKSRRAAYWEADVGKDDGPDTELDSFWRSVGLVRV